MCFGNKRFKPPEIRPVAPPPPVKPLQIAKQSQLQAPRDPKKDEKLNVKYGSKETTAATKKNRDAASLLVPLNEPANNQGGINA